MKQGSIAGALVWLSVSLLCRGSLACDAEKSCTSCPLQPQVEVATSNAESIDFFLSEKKCPDWTDLVFRAVAVSFKGDLSCQTTKGLPFYGSPAPACQVLEVLDLTISGEIADVADTAVVTSMANDGQLECEPNGTMVFNRGRAMFSELDSLYEPVPFSPSGFGVIGTVVGFEVILKNKLSQGVSAETQYWCHSVETTSIIIFDIVNSNGESVLAGNL